eukprot:6737125-Alexandrium_andersonii.AAC.1
MLLNAPECSLELLRAPGPPCKGSTVREGGRLGMPHNAWKAYVHDHFPQLSGAMRPPDPPGALRS